MSPPECAAGAAAHPAGCARLSALHRGSGLATECFDPVQAALHANGRARALPAPSIALKRSTSRAGRNAGGDDARTARERGYEPRPQEPHSLHLQGRTRNVSLRRARFLHVTLSVTACQGKSDLLDGVSRAAVANQGQALTRAREKPIDRARLALARIS
jgi:hypothetical protein